MLLAYHLIKGRPLGELRIWHWSYKEKKYTELLDGHAKVIKFDVEKDLLLLKTKNKVDWKTIDIADSLTMGEELIYFGLNRFRLPRLRYIRAMIDEAYSNKILVNPIFYGDSGGPVFNSSGELVGIITEIYYDYYGPVVYHPLIGGAVPLSEIKEFLK